MADRFPHRGNNSYGSRDNDNYYGHRGRGWKDRGDRRNDSREHQDRDGDCARANNYNQSTNDHRNVHSRAKRGADYKQNEHRQQLGGLGHDQVQGNSGRGDGKRYKTEERPLELDKEGINDLSSQPKEYMEKFKRQLRFEENIYGIPPQAFSPRYSAEEKEQAANYALKEAIARRGTQRDDAAKQKAGGFYSDSSDSDHSYPGASRPKDPFALTTGQKKFFESLKDCLPLTTGFDIEGSTNTKHCYCPCGSSMEKWWKGDRDVALLFEGKDWKKSPCRYFDPLGLMGHLETEGERCILHFGTMKYVEKLYENYNGLGFGHRCLFKMGDPRYKQADAKQTRNLQKTIQVGQQELAKEKEKNRQLELKFEKLAMYSKDLSKQKRMEEEWRRDLNVEKKQKQVFCEADLSAYKQVMRTVFSCLRTNHPESKPGAIKFTVQSSPLSSKASFSLQNFFDDYYDNKPSLKTLATKSSANSSAKAVEKAAEKAAKQVANTRRVLFGSGNEAEYIARALLSTWQITFKDSADQSKEDTAIDEGGPLKQFKADCWKQLNNLSIKVDERWVRLFEDGEGGMMPLPDDVLEYQIGLKMACKEEIPSFIQRATAYVRAVGRIMFNSFQDFDNHAVPSCTMLPIFANLILRGCIPGDDSYDKSDVLKHIVPFTPKPEKNVIKLCLGKKINEDEEDSALWTPDLIFKKFIPDKFIKSRSLLLGSLAEGLSIGSAQEPTALEKGCSLAAVVRAIPLEAIRKILFGKSAITIEEVLATLSPDYCKCEGDWEGNVDETAVERERQAEFFAGDFTRYLKDESSKNQDFLEEFVQFCTGTNYLPFSQGGEDKAFKIIVEFNFTAPEPGGHPMAHTCVNTIRLPGMGIYFDDYDLFCEKMGESLAHCNRFDMN